MMSTTSSFKMARDFSQPIETKPAPKDNVIMGEEISSIAKRKRLLVAMVARGRYEFTERTVRSLIKNVPFDKKISIWHNGDANLDIIMRSYLEGLVENQEYDVEVSFSPADIGWAGAHNANLAQHNLDDYDYVLLTDNDVEYKDGWFDKMTALLEKYPDIGVLAVWKHSSHGLWGKQFPDLVCKDQMPGCGWLFKTSRLKQLLPFQERGTYDTKGGIGEDVNFCNIARDKFGLLIAAPVEDVGVHLDGY